MVTCLDAMTYSLLYLDTFNDVIGRRLWKAGRFISVEAPDPAGKKGRPRKYWRATTAQGDVQYFRDNPEAPRAGGGEERELEEPVVNEEVDALMGEVSSGKTSVEDAADDFKGFFRRATKRMRDAKSLVERGGEDAKSLSEAMSLLQDFSGKMSDVKGDPKKFGEAVATYKKAAEKLQEVTNSINRKAKEKAGAEEKKPAEGDAEKPSEEKAELSTAPWEGKTAEIEKAMMTPVKSRAVPSSTGNKSGAFFDTTESGARIVSKPDELEDPVENSRRSLRSSVRGSQRELAGYQLDRLMSFGVVPPTFAKDLDVSDDDIKKLAAGNPVMAKKKGGKMRGSAQLFVKGKTYHAIEAEAAQAGKQITLKDFYSGMSDKGKVNVQKLAIFDYITGNTDRHSENIMIDGDNVYAIDQGRCFPGKDRSQFNSRPLAALRAAREKIDDRIVKQLKKLDANKVSEVMKKNGMEEEAVHVLQRIKDVLGASGQFELLK